MKLSNITEAETRKIGNHTYERINGIWKKQRSSQTGSRLSAKISTETSDRLKKRERYKEIQRENAKDFKTARQLMVKLTTRVPGDEELIMKLQSITRSIESANREMGSLWSEKIRQLRD